MRMCRFYFSQLVCEVYEDALLQDPTNEEWLSSLFMAYVRICDYKKQQQIALTLHKVKPNNPYYFWAVMSIVMQAYQSNDEISKRITLPLAERMVQKYINEDKIDAEQEIQLYLMILDMQNKHKQSLDVLNGPLGDKLHRTVGLTRKKIDIYFELQMYSEANSYLKDLLLKDIDTWYYYTKYFDSLLRIIEINGRGINGNEEEKICTDFIYDSSIEEALSFLNKLQEINSAQNYPQRGVYLAYLELFLRLPKEEAIKYLGCPIKLLIDYFKIFGQKSCCFYDLKPYMCLLNDDKLLHKFMKALEEIVNLKEGEFPYSKLQMEQFLSKLQLERYVGLHDQLNIDQKLNLADRLLKCYHRCEVFNNNQRSSEIMANDTFVVMMAHVLYDIWVESNKLAYIKEAIVVLEYAFSLSPSNFHIKLLLLKYYHMLGASDASNTAYTNLEIKNTQLDSLGYLHTFQVYSEGRFQNASKLYSSTVRFFSHNYREVADHLTISYKFGSFIKIIEFVEFREKLKNSIHHSMSLIESHFMSLLDSDNTDDYLEIILKMEEIIEYSNKFHFEKMINNRDYSVLVNYNPPSRCLSTKYSSQIFTHDLRFMEIRIALLCCFYYCARLIKEYKEHDLKLSSGANDHNLQYDIQNSKHLIKLDIHLKNLKEINFNLDISPSIPVPKNVFGSFFESKLIIFEKLKCSLSVVIKFIELIHSIAIVEINNSLENQLSIKLKNDVTNLNNQYELAINNCQCIIDKTINEVDPNMKLEGRKEVLEVLCVMIDMTNCSCVLTSMAIHLMNNLQNRVILDPKKIKAKRKNQCVDQNETVFKDKSETIRSIIGIVQNRTNQLLAITKNLEKEWNHLGCSNANGLMLKKFDLNSSYNIAEEDQETKKIRQITADRWKQLVDTIDKKINNSYSGSLDEIIKTLKKKQILINKLSVC
ncbi:N-alpha-acetyltransferase 25, NatB auxiliary subunit isoform X2 [Daktulosphaira vitifoliae]|uniref:N-alpha-acetyltransferase 25, NatB auxiliary subunit isoform X2 n=1 Tax=Daktulosphaira vitifoliae TaxID=58002 RepID=UPI0021AAD94E|nr:N-alpha-acetyltransferase 25, NatB auxiliary subunit isoform X2 [Daktulosphaira vitifoliae]